MPVVVRGVTYYRTQEVCAKVGIGRSTLLRWLRDKTISEASCRDRRGWRLFTESDMKNIDSEAHKIN